MTEEREKELIARLEHAPEMPLLILTAHEAMEAYSRISRRYPSARLLVMKGMRYIAVTDAAVDVITDNLERERAQFADIVKTYDRELSDIRNVVVQGKRCYWAQNAIEPPPVFPEKIAK